MIAPASLNSAFLCGSLLACTLALPAVAQEVAPEGVAASDWESIRAAYDVGRHTVHEAENGFVARNPGQGWRLNFDTRGFLVKSDASDWTWGLELVSYGFVGDKHFVGEAACASADGGRIAYRWDDRIEEWYVNDTRGFEHGFTVNERPQSADEERGVLTLELNVRGDLVPQVQVNRRGISFLDTHGATVLTYTGLTVLDADGRSLDAWFDQVSEGVRLLVDEQDATYPLTIDPVAQEAYLKASNPDPGDLFGFAVSISGDTVVVGAPDEGSAATGTNGNENDNSEEFAGAAYVFRRSGSSWNQEAYLKASNTATLDEFGLSVGVSGETIAVGAPGQDGSGAIYVFRRSGTSWVQQAFLKASVPEGGDKFGCSLGVSGDTIIVGATGEDSNAIGVNGDESDNSNSLAGAAYVFVRTVTGWGQEAYLKASNSGTFDKFGTSASISGDTLVVGALNEKSNASGVNGNESDDSANLAGAAYVFERSGTSWAQDAYLKASNAEAFDRFGNSVGISGNTIVVGAFAEASNATVVNGDENNNSLLAAGAAYVFVRSGTSWNQDAYLKAWNAGLGDHLGASVSISGDTIVVGAWGEDSNASGVNGDWNDNSVGTAGAAYVFTRRFTAWSQEAYLKASNTDGGDRFGFSASVSGDTVVVGAWGESANTIGVNGDGSNNGAPLAGAAYAFLISPTPSMEICNGDGGDGLGCTPCPCGNEAPPGVAGGCLNSAGTSAKIAATGDLSASLPPGLASDLRLTLRGAPAGVLCVMLSGAAIAPQNMASLCLGMDSGVQSLDRDGLRCAVMNTKRHGGRAADGSGTITDSTGPSRVWGGEAQPNGGLWRQGGFVAGQTRYFQVTYREDPLAVCGRGLNTSQAVEIVFEP